MSVLRIFASTALSVAIALSATPARAQLTPEKGREIQELWDSCRDVWFKEKNLTLRQKMDLFRKLEPNRKLTEQQKSCILRVANLLIDKQSRWGDRDGAAHWLGEMGHAYCMPALIAVLRDERDKSRVRLRCVLSLAHIADKRVVDVLIDAIADGDLDVARTAWGQLDKLLSFGNGFELTDIPHPGIGPGHWDKDLQSRKELQKKYREWWNKHRDRVKLNRSATFFAF